MAGKKAPKFPAKQPTKGKNQDFGAGAASRAKKKLAHQKNRLGKSNTLEMK